MFESLWLSSTNSSGTIAGLPSKMRGGGRGPGEDAPGSNGTAAEPLEASVATAVVDPESLSQDDWDFLLRGAKLQSFQRNDPIVTEGQIFQRIYQIVDGVCRIEKAGVSRVLGTMEAGQMFGEISFLISGGATASVIADSEIVEVHVLEGYFINILFGMRPEIAGRFYKHLASVLQKRIRSREAGK